MVDELVRHLRQRSVVVHARAVGQGVGQQADELGHDAGQLVQIGGLVRGERAVGLEEAVAEPRQARERVGVLQEELRRPSGAQREDLR